MTKVVAAADLLLMEYTGPQGGVLWVHERFRAGDDVTLLRGVFSFEVDDALTPITRARAIDGSRDFRLDPAELEEDFEEFRFEFLLGAKEGDYYRIAGRKLRVSQDVYIAPEVRPALKHFVVPTNVSVFRELAKLTPEDIYIGGPGDNAILEAQWADVVGSVPTKTELSKYASARVSAVLRNCIDGIRDAEGAYETYRRNRESARPDLMSTPIRADDVARFRAIRERLGSMLSATETFTEHVWQQEIADILTLMYPKYVAALREGPILRDESSRPLSVDFVLVDADGNVDLLEVKKPVLSHVMSRGVYRDNHVPARDLAGAVMQLEKYLYRLSRSGVQGEKKLAKKFACQLPSGLELKVTNPKGLVLLGRDTAMTESQRLDFEIVRRQYRNVVDILTYDDLHRRLDVVLRCLGGEAVSVFLEKRNDGIEQPLGILSPHVRDPVDPLPV